MYTDEYTEVKQVGRKEKDEAKDHTMPEKNEAAVARRSFCFLALAST